MKPNKFKPMLALSFPIALLACDLSFADTVLFPVIAVNQPNVTTLVSVFNLPGSTSSHLRYVYRSKESLVGGLPNHTGNCTTTSFVRPTYDSDLVTFDTSGVFNSGNALFNDGNAYLGSFELGLSGPRRAYLLVTNSDSGGNRVDVSDNQALGGEAIVMDIASGAAWGMRALNDTGREDYTFDKAGVGTVIQGSGHECKRLSFFSPADWRTRLFATPVGASMIGANLDGSMTLWGHSAKGVYNRDGTFQSSSVSADVTCTAGVDVEEMIDSSVLASLENTGGWAWVCPLDASGAPSANPIALYKLEYVVNDPTYGGTNNNGYLLSVDDQRW